MTRGWLAVLASALLTLGGGALAQYRPPPMGDAERFIADGDELREAAAKAGSFGEKDTATARLKEAVAAYEKALVADPNAVAAAAGLGVACTSLKDWPKILAVLGPMHEKFPADQELNYSLGVALLKTRKYPEATKLLTEVGKANRPDLFLTHYYLGWLALQQQDGEHAVQELDRYLAERPASVASNDHEILVFKGRGYLLERNAKLARSAFEGAKRAKPDSVGALMGLAAVLELEGRNPEAVKMLEELVQRFATAPEPKERLARLYLAAGDLKRAEAQALALLKLPESSTSHLLMGDVKMAQKQYGAAESELRAAVKLAPGQPAVLMSLANVLQVQGRHDDAIAMLEQVNAQHPNTVELLAALGTVCRRASRYPKALATHQEVVRLQPKAALGHVLLGADHYAMGDWDSAIADYATAMEREPANKSARHWLAQALGRRAKVRTEKQLLDDAVRDLRRAFDLEKTALAARSLGALLLSQGQFPEARTVLASGVGLPGSTWVDQYLLGYAWLGVDDAKAALGAFEQAQAAADPDGKGLVAVGVGLARLQAGDLDVAVNRLADQSKLASSNLHLAYLRRALERLHDGELQPASRDFEIAAQAPHPPDLERVEDLVRGLLAVEQGRYDAAQVSFKKALPPGDRSPDSAATRTFLAAYVDYRRGRSPDARKKLDTIKKTEGVPELIQANTRRDGELSYLQHAMPRAEKMFREALAIDPQNAWVAHNLACVQYRKGTPAPAVATWKALIGAVPESSLNLGIYSQAAKDLRSAVAYYDRYLRTRGSHLGLAREWRDRLEAIYGITATGVAAEPDEAADEGKPEEKKP